jgi:hypothetical protein
LAAFLLCAGACIVIMHVLEPVLTSRKFRPGMHVPAARNYTLCSATASGLIARCAGYRAWLLFYLCVVYKCSFVPTDSKKSYKQACMHAMQDRLIVATALGCPECIHAFDEGHEVQPVCHSGDENLPDCRAANPGSSFNSGEFRVEHFQTSRASISGSAATLVAVVLLSAFSAAPL